MRAVWLASLVATLGGLSAQEDSFSPPPSIVADPSVSTHLDSSLLSDVEGESHEFRAETGRLMDIIVNSLYTERDVFLRELVSNAADALEKVRVTGLKNASIYEADDGTPLRDLNVLIKLDKDRGEISIIDTGIGMTKEELAHNLGTVAKSGTEQFIEAAKRGASASNLIGQFGVGFYSAYLVADEITVVSKSPFDSKQWVWKSESQRGGFKIFEDPRKQKLGRGTIVTLKLKNDAKKYVSRYELRKVAKRFSSFVPYPVYLGEVRGEDEEIQWQRINNDKPIWLQDKSDLDAETYEAFYKNLTGESEPPLTWTHFRAEGDIDFSALMYIPHSTRRDLTTETAMDSDSEVSDVRLYVQRVLISDQLKDFFPTWLSFVRGVIDSNDLPLKVDRETFSSTKVMKVIKKKTISKVLDTLRLLSRDADVLEDTVNEFIRENEPLIKHPERQRRPEDLAVLRDGQAKYAKYFEYVNLWDTFGQAFMLGCMEGASASDRPKLLSLFRGRSTTRNSQTSLESYVARMRPGQKHIYYITGDDLEVVLNSPYLELFVAKEVEVLILLGAFEEGCFQRSKDFKGLDFVSIEKDTFASDEFAYIQAGTDAEKQKEIAAATEREWEAAKLLYKPLVDWVAEVLGVVNAQYVSVARTLVNSPAKVSSPTHGFTAATERMARTSVGANRLMVEAFAKMKTFEVNPYHWLIHYLLEQIQFQQSHETQDLALQRDINDTINLLYESSLISSGFPPRRPHIVTNHLYSLLSMTKQSEYDLANPFRLVIPDNIYEQVDREAKTKAAKAKTQQAKRKQQQPSEDEDEEEDDYEELFDHDEL